MKMHPVLWLGIAAVALLAFTSKGRNILSQATNLGGAPGPGAQGLGTTPNPTGNFSPGGAGVSGVSPNSTLATVNQGVVVANNALGFFSGLKDQFFPSSNDSSYTDPLPIDYVGGSSDQGI